MALGCLYSDPCLKHLLCSPLGVHVTNTWFSPYKITLVTSLQLQAVPPTSNDRNRTWGYAPVVYWSAIETAAGLICACLLGLRKVRYMLRGKEK